MYLRILRPRRRDTSPLLLPKEVDVVDGNEDDMGDYIRDALVGGTAAGAVNWMRDGESGFLTSAAVGAGSSALMNTAIESFTPLSGDPGEGSTLGKVATVAAGGAAMYGLRDQIMGLGRKVGLFGGPDGDKEISEPEQKIMEEVVAEDRHAKREARHAAVDKHAVDAQFEEIPPARLSEHVERMDPIETSQLLENARTPLAASPIGIDADSDGPKALAQLVEKGGAEAVKETVKPAVKATAMALA